MLYIANAWASAARSRGGRGPLLDFHTLYRYSTVDRGLIVLFFGPFLLFFSLFSVGYLWKRLNSALFGLFLLFFGLFFRVALFSPGNFSADALEHMFYYFPLRCYFCNNLRAYFSLIV